MAYNWAQLAFVEKWRLQAVRGLIVGMYRPEDRTYFDLRIRPGEGGAGQLTGSVDLRLQDPGDIILDKRMRLLDRVPVIVRVVGSLSAFSGQAPPAPGKGRRWLERDSTVSGKLVRLEDDTAVVDVGFPVLVALEGGTPDLQPGQAVHLAVSEAPKGFIVS